MPEPRQSWDRFFLDLARHWATRSKDPSTKVGAVIINDLRQQVASGYNGFPRQISDAPALLNSRADKLARVIHAEMNAILTAREDVRGCTLYVSLLPCSDCAKHVVQAGIRRVVAAAPTEEQRDRWGKQFELARALYEEAGVAVTVLADERAPCE